MREVKEIPQGSRHEATLESMQSDRVSRKTEGPGRTSPHSSGTGGLFYMFYGRKVAFTYFSETIHAAAFTHISISISMSVLIGTQKAMQN